jgi:hypothetical protein
MAFFSPVCRCVLLADKQLTTFDFPESSNGLYFEQTVFIKLSLKRRWMSYGIQHRAVCINIHVQIDVNKAVFFVL